MRGARVVQAELLAKDAVVGTGRPQHRAHRALRLAVGQGDRAVVAFAFGGECGAEIRPDDGPGRIRRRQARTQMTALYGRISWNRAGLVAFEAGLRHGLRRGRRRVPLWSVPPDAAVAAAAAAAPSVCR